MLGGDTLTVTVNGVSYSHKIYINNEKWSLSILYPELAVGSYDVVATTTRASNNAIRLENTNKGVYILM